MLGGGEMAELSEFKATYVTRDGQQVTEYIQATDNFHARKYLKDTIDAKKIISVVDVPESMSLF